MSKVLVRKAVDVQYPVAGPPILVTGGGGRRGQGVRGTTKRERGLGLLGGAVGVLGAFGGRHRSLGSLAQSAISGGSQGRAIGRGLGRSLTGRGRQARADRDEKTRQQYAAETAQYKRGESPFEQFRGPAIRPETMRQRMAYVEGQRQDLTQQMNERARARRFEQDIARNRRMAREKARGYEEGEKDARMRQTGQNTIDMLMAMGFPEEEAHSIVAQGGFAGRSGNVTTRVEPAGPTPNVNAANRPVKVIGPNTTMNMLPAPSNPQDGAAGENKRMDDMGDKALIAQGTDTAREATVGAMPPQQQEGDKEMSDQQREAIERQMMMQGRVRVQSSQPQGNTRQAGLDEFTE